jgi:hypothetical protein
MNIKINQVKKTVLKKKRDAKTEMAFFKPYTRKVLLLQYNKELNEK